jgi:hypothetical protein
MVVASFYGGATATRRWRDCAMGERDRDDTRDAAEDAPPGSDTFHEGVLFEGLRPPLTLVQRRRRTAITTIIIVGALAVLF